MQSIIKRFLIIAVLLSAWSVGATTYYYDATLESDCVGGAGTSYRIANRDCGGSDGTKAWNDLHSINAHASLVAGDIVYMRGGTEDFETVNCGQNDSATECINPQYSGSAGSPITYAMYNGEKINFVSNYAYAAAIRIINRSWIKITGYDGATTARNLKFSNFFGQLHIYDGSTTVNPVGVGSSYNEISYVEFTESNSAVVSNGNSTDITKIQHNSSYNWVHHCTISKIGGYTTSDAGVGIDIGHMDCGSNDGTCEDTTSNNVIEDNIVTRAGHHTLGVHQKNNVIRNNVFSNEQYYQGTDSIWYGYRNWINHASVGTDGHAGYNLYEGNRISHASNNYNSSLGSVGIHIGNPNEIYRYNDIYANGNNAIVFENHSAATTGLMSGNHIYNNTIFANGYGDKFPDAFYNTDSPPCNAAPASCNYVSSPPNRSPFYFASGNGATGISRFATQLYGNVIKNNLFWGNYTGTLIAHSGMSDTGWDFGDCTGQTVCGDTEGLAATGYASAGSGNFNAYNEAAIDPTFTSDGAAIYSSPTAGSTNKEWYWGESTPDGSSILNTLDQPDFTLQSTSVAIDYGTYLTTAHGAGESTTTLVVHDAKYFQPGWGKWASGGPSVAADTICVGTVSNCSLIESIVYATNTITLVDSLTWADDASVWLQKNSSGTTVLYGTTTDAGAHEYDNSGTPPSYTATVALSGAGAIMTHSGDYTVATGETLNIGVTRHNGWNGAWSTSDAVNCVVSGCSVPNQGESATCSVTVGAECTVTYTATEIYLFN